MGTGGLCAAATGRCTGSPGGRARSPARQAVRHRYEEHGGGEIASALVDRAPARRPAGGRGAWTASCSSSRHGRCATLRFDEGPPARTTASTWTSASRYARPGPQAGRRGPTGSRTIASLELDRRSGRVGPERRPPSPGGEMERRAARRSGRRGGMEAACPPGRGQPRGGAGDRDVRVAQARCPRARPGARRSRPRRPATPVLAGRPRRCGALNQIRLRGSSTAT